VIEGLRGAKPGDLHEPVTKNETMEKGGGLLLLGRREKGGGKGGKTTSRCSNKKWKKTPEGVTANSQVKKTYREEKRGQ